MPFVQGHIPSHPVSITLLRATPTRRTTRRSGLETMGGARPSCGRPGWEGGPSWGRAGVLDFPDFLQYFLSDAVECLLCVAIRSGTLSPEPPFNNATARHPLRAATPAKLVKIIRGG